MANYTVKRGDTLSAIAQKYNPTYHYGTTGEAACKRLAEINDIDDPNYIVVGQILKLDNPTNADGTNQAVAKTGSKGSAVVIKAFGVQSNTERTMYVSWAWSKSQTKDYKVMWYYATGDGVWFVGDDATTEYKQSVYSAPENAKRVKVKILPESNTHKVKNKDTKYWTASWSTFKEYVFPGASLIEVPSAPAVTIDQEALQLTAELDNIAAGATYVQFQVVRNDSKITSVGLARITTGHAGYKCNVGPGYEYKVRCRACTVHKGNDSTLSVNQSSKWSEYSDGITTRPPTPKRIKTLKATSATSILITWEVASKAKSYEIQRTTDPKYFDSSPDNVQSTTVEANVAHAEITGLDSGDEYYFRVRAANDSGNSGWTGIKSVILGKAPAAPTTWASSSTVVAGDDVYLYWIHNSQDGSDEKMAIVSYVRKTDYMTWPEVQIDVPKSAKPGSPDEAVDETSCYKLETGGRFAEGDYIDWQIQTKGISDSLSPRSVKRRIQVHQRPSLAFTVLDYKKEPFLGHALDQSSADIVRPLTKLPFYIDIDYSPFSENTAIGVHITIESRSYYSYEDYAGNVIEVAPGDEIYSKYYRTSSTRFGFGAKNVTLENNRSYKITVTITLNSGLTATCSNIMNVGWENERDYEPTCRIDFNRDSLTASINAYCADENNKCTPATTLAVYRRNYDGTFTEIGSGLPNNKYTFVTDPHPALNWLWYRIVATFTDTGEQTYYDPPAEPVGITSIVMQWNEARSSYLNYDSILVENEVDGSMYESGYSEDFRDYSGSMLVLAYNVDISPVLNKDVALVEYVGRENPVSYYGTQLGETATWSAEIPKSDEATLYTLRRLARWQGDVYVREPSGIGYWATVGVTYSRKHCELTVPVTLTITRVAEPADTGLSVLGILN